MKLIEVLKDIDYELIKGDINIITNTNFTKGMI